MISEEETGILEVARAGATTASAVCRRVQASLADVAALYKDAREPVTVADYGSQAVVLEAVSARFPEHSVVAEEGAEHLRSDGDPRVREMVTELVGDALGRSIDFDQVCAWIDHDGDTDSRYTWVIDPIDGTKGFLRGDQYAVAVGILRDLEPWGGVLGCPNLPLDLDDDSAGRGILLVAARGQGVRQLTLDSDLDEAVTVSDVDDAADARILGSVESAHGDPVVMTALIERLGLGGGIVRLDSQAKYAMVASGRAEIYLRPQSRPDYRERIWDHAAGVLAVEEAGGRVTDIYGQPLDFSRGSRLEDNRGVVATNGPLHEDVLAALAEILGPPAS